MTDVKNTINEHDELVESSAIDQVKEDKKENILDALDSDLPIHTSLTSKNGVFLKKFLSATGNIEGINKRLHMIASLDPDIGNQSISLFDMVIDENFFNNECKTKLFLEKVLADDIYVFLFGPIDIDFLTHTAIELGIFGRSEEEIKSILASKISYMPREKVKQNIPKLLELISKLMDLDSITIFAGENDNVKKLINHKLLEIDFSKVKNTNFVLAELSEKGNKMQNFHGIKAAFDIYTHESDKNLVLMSALDLKTIKSINKEDPKLDFLLKQKNVRFLYLFEPSAFAEFVEETGFDVDNFDGKLKPRPLPTFDAKLLETLFEPDYLSTIDFKMGMDRPDNAVKEMKNVLQKINLQNIQNCLFIDVCAKYEEGQHLQQMVGLTIAMEELRKSPDKKLILTVPLADVSVLKALAKKANKEDILDFLLARKNVKFFEYQDDPQKLEHIFEEQDTPNTEEESNTEITFQKIIESEISRFLHDAKYWVDLGSGDRLTYEEQLPYLFNLPQEKKNDTWIAFEDKLISLLQIQHSSFKSLPRENNLQRIVDMYTYSRANILPEGTRFEGVFVDWDGTLYDNKKLKFNQNIIDMIKEYERQGKKITIRTGGNIPMKQKLLDEIGLPYTVKNKTDYKGATVEIAIDNDSPDVMFANAKLKAEKHIQV